MLVDAKTEAARNQKISAVVIAGFMSPPLLGQVVAMIVLFCLAMQIISKSANRMKDIGSLLWISIVYIFTMAMAVLAPGPSPIPFLGFVGSFFDRLPFFAPPVIALVVIVLGKGVIRKFGFFWFVWTVAALFDRGMHANGMIQMTATLFVVSYWGIMKMKAFLFDR